MTQYIYCFETTFNIIKEFKKPDKKPDDYAVYKIGKTTRPMADRLSEHGSRVKDVKLQKSVYDCDTTERDLIAELNAKLATNTNLIHRRDNLSSEKEEETKLKNIKGLEYYEGRYSDIEPILNLVLSAEYQNCRPRNMDVDFICHICNKKFNVSGTLKSHMHTHESGINKDVTSFRAKKEELPPREPSKRIRGKTSNYRERSTSLSPSPPKTPPKAKTPSPKLKPPSPKPKPPSPKPKPPSPKARSLPKPKPPSPKARSLPKPKPPSPKALQYQARSAKQPTYISNFKIKSASPLADYTSDIELQESFIELLKKFKLDEKNKRKRPKARISPNSRLSKKTKIVHTFVNS